MKSTFLYEEETKQKLVDFINKTNILSMGEQCARYEQKFSHKQGRRYAVFVSSGSMANLVLMQAMLNLGRLKKGDRVGVSALTWSTNVMPIIQLGLRPVIIDCELETLNISKKGIEAVHKKLPMKAVFITNALGFADHIDEIKKFCEESQIILLEDNCESLGTKIKNGELLGNYGLASTFSTFVGHHLSTIEGGMICTDDQELHEMLVMVRAHGWDRNLSGDSQKELRNKYKVENFYAKYTFYDLAYNARPTEIQGFIGNIQIEYWDEIIEKRSRNFDKFFEAAKINPEIKRMSFDHIDTISNFAMPLVFNDKELFEKYKNKFEKAEVEIRPIIAGNISKQPFFKKYVEEEFSCPNADLIHENGFYFGNNPELTSEEIAVLSNLLKK